MFRYRDHSHQIFYMKSQTGVPHVPCNVLLMNIFNVKMTVNELGIMDKKYDSAINCWSWTISALECILWHQRFSYLVNGYMVICKRWVSLW